MSALTPRCTDVEGIAEYLGDSPRHIRHLVASRQIPFFRIGRKLRFDYREIDQWVDINSVPVGGLR